MRWTANRPCNQNRYPNWLARIAWCMTRAVWCGISDLRDRYGITQPFFRRRQNRCGFYWLQRAHLGPRVCSESDGNCIPSGSLKNDKICHGRHCSLPSWMFWIHPSFRHSPLKMRPMVWWHFSGWSIGTWIYGEIRCARAFLQLRQPARHADIFLDSLNFIEVETPVLIKSTPEGAIWALSAYEPGEFYALPQSPQNIRKTTVDSGIRFDRYYQIVKCFRDEDLRRPAAWVHTNRRWDGFIEQEAYFGTHLKDWFVTCLNRWNRY